MKKLLTRLFKNIDNFNLLLRIIFLEKLIKLGIIKESEGLKEGLKFMRDLINED